MRLDEVKLKGIAICRAYLLEQVKVLRQQPATQEQILHASDLAYACNYLIEYPTPSEVKP